MTIPAIDPDPGPSPGHRPAPLTCATKDGRPYTRFPDIEARIGEALAEPMARWPELEATRSGKRWPPEMLVHLVRCAQHADQRVLGALMHTLLMQTERIIADWAKGYDATTLDEIASAVTIDVVELIMAETPTRASEYLEIAFTMRVKQMTLKAVAQRKDHPKRGAFQSTFADETDGNASLVETLEDKATLDPLQTLIEQGRGDPIRTLLKAVTDKRHRVAFILHELRGWPYTSPDPSIPTLCARFRPVGERQIRNWIIKAKTQMRAAYGELQ